MTKGFRRLANLALIFIVLFSLGHLVGFAISARAARESPELADLTRAMAAQRNEVLGLEASVLDYREYFSVCFSILLLLVARLGQLALASDAGTAAAARKVGGALASGFLALALASAFYSVAQGLIASLSILVTIGIALLRPGSVRVSARAGATLLVVLFLAAGPAVADDLSVVAASETWRCPPCGCAHDHQVFTSAGVCPSCGMALVPASSLPAVSVPDQLLRRVQILLFDGVQMIDWAGPYDVFAVAGFSVATVSSDGAEVVVSSGARVTPTYSFADAPAADVLVVPGGDGVEALLARTELLEWIRQRASSTPIVLSVCTGSLVLARAGLLDGLTATTFHSALDWLAEQAPRTTVVADQRFVDADRIVTTSGLSSGIDGALHAVDRLLGRSSAQRTALALEYQWNPDAEWARASLADAPLREALGRGLRLDLSGGTVARLLSTSGDEHRWRVRWSLPPSALPEMALQALELSLSPLGWKRGRVAAGSRSYSFADAARSPWTAESWARPVGPIAEAPDGALLVGLDLERAELAAETHLEIGPNVRVSSEALRRPVVEPHLAAHPTRANRLLVAAMSVTDPHQPFESSRLVTFASDDGGSSWSATEHDAWGYDPWALIEPDGKAIVSWLGESGKFRGSTPILLRHSPDAGASWSATSGIPGAFDGGKLTRDPRSGALFLAAASFEDEMAIYVNRAAPGQPFTTPRSIAQEGNHVRIGQVAVTKDGTVAVLGHAGDEASGIRHSSLWIHRSTDGGATFSSPIRVSRRVGSRKGYAHLVADTGSGPFAGRLYVVRASGGAESAGGIWLNRSVDDGLSWSRDVRVDVGAAHDSALAMLPAVVVRDDGVIAVSWISRDASPQGWTSNRVFLALSRDGGHRFSRPVEISEVAADPRTPGNARTAIEMPGGGHYMGIAARADGVFQLVWSDSRNGVFELFTATARLTRSGDSAPTG